MEWIRMSVWRRVASICLSVLIPGLTGCSLQGKMEWVQPTTTAPRVGVVYCIRGWHGVWSLGIDEMARQLNEKGVTARVFMNEQHKELAATIIERYRNSPNHEPICFIGHSWGVDASILIAKELDKAGIPVDVICCLDSVDQTTVPKNVRLCYNYWMPGIFWNTNILRGIPLKQEPGSTGQLFNYDCSKEYRSWRGASTDHTSFDDDPKIQKHIIDNILDACPPRADWHSPGPTTSASIDSFR